MLHSPLPPPPPANPNEAVCQICNELMSEGQDCLIIIECSHVYHRNCIENFLTTSSECPTCKRPCALSELKSFNITAKTLTNTQNTARGKGRGAMAKHYNTRSFSKNVSNPSQVSTENTNARNQRQLEFTPERNTQRINTDIGSPAQNSNTNRSPRANNNIDYEQINSMIQENLSKMLQNLNLIPNPIQNNSSPYSENNSHLQNPLARHTTNVQSEPNTNFRNQPGGASNFSSTSNIYQTDKVTNIIQNWNLKFDGSANGIRIEEFLYRIRSLTYSYFGGDFSIICNNLHILLSGKARDWFWAYHKNVQSIQWQEFCEAIRSKYRDYKSSFQIQEEIRNRKQRLGETFDTFFDDVSAIMNRLATPLPENDLVEILIRNLRPEIRQDLLYVPINSISDLRRLVQKRENFLNDDHVKRNLASRNPNGYIPRRQIAELEVDDEFSSLDSTIEQDPSVNAVSASNVPFKCWNCDGLGHHWEDCLQERQIFCYGCGAKKIYKPNCTRCLAKKASFSKNFRQNPPIKEQL